MKKILSILFVASTFYADGQNESDDYHSSVKGPTCRDIHFGISTGFNNHGAIAAQFEYITKKGLSADINIGLGGWLLKKSLDIKYYFGECGLGFSVGAGFSYCTFGGTGQLELLTVDSSEKKVNQSVTVRLYPLAHVKFFGSYYWQLGKKMRFFLKFGYESRITTKPYYVLSNHILAQESKQTLEMMAGGGLLLAIGFSF